MSMNSLASAKPPPLLLGAVLLFWGWQTTFLGVAIPMAVALESARFIKACWEFSDDDFARIWTFCSLLFLAAAVYAFTANDGPANFRGLFQDLNFQSQHSAGTASSRTAASLIRWMPMVFFLFVAAQAFSSRQGVPLETISLILRRRWKKARQAGQAPPSLRTVNVTYPYFAACLFAASARPAENTVFFWGLAALLAWTFWSQRSRRFAVPIWAATLGLAIALGYLGQNGVGRLRSYLETFNPQWLANFSQGRFDATRSKTALGQIGRVKTSGRIVIRLQPLGQSQPPALLREASYREYKSQIWYAGNSGSDFENIASETNNTTWLLVPDKTNRAAAKISCYLPGGKGLLPLPEGSGRLDNLAAFDLRKNLTGAVAAQGPGLVIFDAAYGPGANLDSPGTFKEDCSVSARETAALDEVISELHLRGQNAEQAAKTLSGFFQGKFTYRMWQPPAPGTNANETPLSRFLLQTRSGHCEYFATATVLLLRRIGIQARYAVGYAVHEAAGKKFVVRQRDAHAWCLVWNEPKQLWQDLDTTPASWVEAENSRASPFQMLSDAWSRLRFEISRLRYGQTNLRQYILLALVPILALLLYQIISRSRRQRLRGNRNRKGHGIPWPGLDSEFYQLEKKLVDRGIIRGPSEPLSVWLSRAASHPTLAPVKQPLQVLLNLHYRHRFDPRGLAATERERLRRETQACVERII